MSASLVGSEMCIRDRCVHEGSPGPDATLDLCLGPCWPLFGLQGQRGGGCLLYTSDAADDM
eukprot:10202639-Alexandrium_andersonii.AAC.1